MNTIQQKLIRKILCPETSGEKIAAKQDEAHKARLEELVFKAVNTLATQGIFAKTDFITQVGIEGFHWRLPGQVIPIFERWFSKTVIENRRIFNAHA